MPHLLSENYSPINIDNIKSREKVCSNAVEFMVVNSCLKQEKIRWIYESEKERDLDFERIKKELGELNV